VRSLVMLGQVLRRFLLLVENMLRSLAAALAELTRGLWGIARTFARELLTPALALGGANVLLYLLTGFTRAYIEQNSVAAVLEIAGAVAGILASAMLFIGSLAPFRAERIVRFTMEFGGWLMPNLLVFFLLMSLSLCLTSRFMNSYASDLAGGALPFRVGVLTWLDISVLMLLVAVVIWKRRAFFKVEGAGEARSAERGARNEANAPAAGRAPAAARPQPRPASAPVAADEEDEEDDEEDDEEAEAPAAPARPAAKMSKPVAAYIAGVTAPAGKKMGHAGAIVSGGKGTAAAKMDALRDAGAKVGQNPTECGELMADIVSKL
jgi:hypothetical protein